MNLRATPFHNRTSALNRLNRWTTRSGFTLPLDFGDAASETLAARTRVAIGDISWRARVLFEGSTAADTVAKLFTRDPRKLVPGRALKALWLNDGGAVRGAGVVSRLASDKFLIASAADDFGWFDTAASLSGNRAQLVTPDEGGISLIGPYAAKVLAVAGLPSDLEPLEIRKQFWRGLDVTITRWGEQNGYELWCKADDCSILWDRIWLAGANFDIDAFGAGAADILDVEAGVARPSRDYLAASDGFSAEPTPDSLALEKLIDQQHDSFNGRAAWFANRGKADFTIVGLEFDTERPAPFCPLISEGKTIGTTLTSVYSPLFRRAIALARVEKALAKAGTTVALTLPISLENLESKKIAARVRELPFVEPLQMIG